LSHDGDLVSDNWRQASDWADALRSCRLAVEQPNQPRAAARFGPTPTGERDYLRRFCALERRGSLHLAPVRPGPLRRL